jgi:hypothetical protein
MQCMFINVETGAEALRLVNSTSMGLNYGQAHILDRQFRDPVPCRRSLECA